MNFFSRFRTFPEWHAFTNANNQLHSIDASITTNYKELCEPVSKELSKILVNNNFPAIIQLITHIVKISDETAEAMKFFNNDFQHLYDIYQTFSTSKSHAEALEKKAKDAAHLVEKTNQNLINLQRKSAQVSIIQKAQIDHDDAIEKEKEAFDEWKANEVVYTKELETYQAEFVTTLAAALGESSIAQAKSAKVIEDCSRKLKRNSFKFIFPSDHPSDTVLKHRIEKLKKQITQDEDLMKGKLQIKEDDDLVVVDETNIEDVPSSDDENVTNVESLEDLSISVESSSPDLYHSGESASNDHVMQCSTDSLNQDYPSIPDTISKEEEPIIVKASKVVIQQSQVEPPQMGMKKSSIDYLSFLVDSQMQDSFDKPKVVKKDVKSKAIPQQKMINQFKNLPEPKVCPQQVQEIEDLISFSDNKSSKTIENKPKNEPIMIPKQNVAVKNPKPKKEKQDNRQNISQEVAQKEITEIIPPKEIKSPTKPVSPVKTEPIKSEPIVDDKTQEDDKDLELLSLLDELEAEEPEPVETNAKNLIDSDEFPSLNAQAKKANPAPKASPNNQQSNPNQRNKSHHNRKNSKKKHS